MNGEYAEVSKLLLEVEKQCRSFFSGAAALFEPDAEFRGEENGK